MIKHSLTLALLLIATVAKAATLSWEPSDATLGPPAVNYKVYSATVGNPSNAVWTVFGTTTTTNLPIAGNVYKMFQVTGVSAAGAESAPSNVVTNDLANPSPPGRLKVSSSIDAAPGINGPWLELTNVVTVVSMVTPPQNQFFRSRTEIVTLERP